MASVSVHGDGPDRGINSKSMYSLSLSLSGLSSDIGVKVQITYLIKNNTQQNFFIPKNIKNVPSRWTIWTGFFFFLFLKNIHFCSHR